MFGLYKRLLFGALLAFVLAAAATGADERVVGYQCRAKYDGTFEMWYLVSGPGQAVREMSEKELRSALPAA